MAMNVGNYTVPKTGLGPRVVGGAMPKDTGEHSSRVAQIQKMGGKTPGPKYRGHNDWRLQGGNKFPNSQRKGLTDKKQSGPAPTAYNVVNSAQTTLPRAVALKWCANKKRNFLDSAIARGKTVPAPGKYTLPIEKAHCPTVKWDTTKTKSIKPDGASKQPGPGTYTPNHDAYLERQAVHKVGKETGGNFVDKAVGPKKGIPGPNQYPLVQLKSISRGTKWAQVHQIDGKRPVHNQY